MLKNKNILIFSYITPINFYILYRYEDEIRGMIKYVKFSCINLKI